MSVRRQYSLPNVSLILDGWSDEATPSPQPSLSIVTEVQCQFLPQQQQLAGGKELLDALVAGVGAYVQDFLADLHPKKAEAEVRPGCVRLQPADRVGYHHLTWQPPVAEGTSEVAGAARVEFELSTVQLFDLVEALDQLLLDGTTVPDLGFQLKPRPLGTRQAERPLAQRSTPAAVGLAGFAVAAAALLMVPVPEMREVDPERQEELAEGSESARVLPAGIDTDLASVPRLNEQVELSVLAGQVRRRIDGAWEARGAVTEPLSYRVWVTRGGDEFQIAGFAEVSGDRPAIEAPVLPRLLVAPENPSLLPQIAEFRVTFNPDGDVTVEPWVEEDAPTAE